MSSPTKAEKVLKSFKGTYLGSVVAVPHMPPEHAIPRAIEFARTREEADGKPMQVQMQIYSSEIRSSSGKELVQSIDLESLVYVGVADSDPNIVILTTVSADGRLSVRLSHVYMFKGKSTEVETAVDNAFANLKVPIARERPTPGMQVFDALYLGHNRVLTEVDKSVILKAIRQNGVVRQGMETERITKKKRRYSLESAKLVQEDYGTAVAEHPVAIQITKRTVRIVDCMSGETVEKMTIRNIELSEEVPSGRSTVGLIHMDRRLNDTQCHLFFPMRGEGNKICAAIRNFVQQGADEKKRMSVVSGGPFTPAKDAKREAAPPELFKLQIHRGDIVAKHVLGAGEFGEVYLATQNAKSKKTGKPVEVPRAVKTLKTGGATEADKNEFLREAMIMLAVGKHANVVRMVGVAVQQAPWLVVLEFMRYGDLRAVMMALESKRIKLNTREKLNLSVQLAAGCEHLAKRKLVHMDLAARNVLVGDNSLIKIADFGLTRPFDEGTSGVTLSEPIRLAIKWAAPESITQLKFSEASDCWSLGVTVWEIFAYGKMPWLGVTNVGVLQQIAKKKRMEKPKGCHNSAWSILEQCWHILPARRPSFRAVKDMFRECIANFSSEDLRDIGLLAASDARASGAGGDTDKRPYAKLYGMIGSSYEDVDIDDDIEDVGAADAYAIASKAQTGGYSKTAPPRAGGGGGGGKKKGPKKRQSIKRKKGGASKKKKKSGAGETEAEEEYGWGGVQVEDNPMYAGGGGDEINTDDDDDFAGFGDDFDEDEAAANLDRMVGSPGADSITGDDGYEMPVGSAGAPAAVDEDGYEMPVGSAGYVPDPGGEANVDGYGLVKPMRPRGETGTGLTSPNEKGKKGMKKSTSSTSHVAVDDIYSEAGRGGGGGGEPLPRKRSQTDAGGKKSKAKAKAKDKDKARPRSATAVTPSKDKKKKKGGGGARTNMPAIPDNMADNFLATLKRK